VFEKKKPTKTSPYGMPSLGVENLAYMEGEAMGSYWKEKKAQKKREIEQKQQQLREVYFRELAEKKEEALDRTNAFGIFDPTPKEAVDLIRDRHKKRTARSA